MVHRAGKSTELLRKVQTFWVTRMRLSSISCPLVPLPRAAVTIIPKEARKAAWGAGLACLAGCWQASRGTPHARHIHGSKSRGDQWKAPRGAWDTSPSPTMSWTLTLLHP